RDSIERFVQDHYAPTQRAALISSDLGYSPANWRLYADMGWLGLPFEERYGGYGGSPVDTAILMEALGRGLVLEPYISSVLMGGGLVAAAGLHAQKDAILPRLIAGELTLACAYLEPQSRFNPADVETTADAVGDGYRIDGHKCVVYQGSSADRIIVSARTAGSRCERVGISLFLLSPNHPGVTRKDYKTLDGQNASEFYFRDVRLGHECLLGEVGQALPSIEQTLDRVVSAVCAEAVGAMEASNAITRDYIKKREQFGVPIGSFQVLQHRWVDMHTEAEMAKSMSDVLAMRLRDGDAEGGAMVAAAKVRVGKAAQAVGQGAVQLHGGIGMTDEYPIGHYYKRLMMIDMLFGNQDYHATQYERLTAAAS
ncbi:MAG: acyl-CoA dehydrogenase family protein, partial [Halioglobus sp.]|nr:acyl-CoA dehydrogenase family protein [Halioglobus sp.]